MIADRARRRVMLASVARTLHVGPLADCFFDSATALCLKRVTTTDPGQPLTALCEPTRCSNACITARHRPAWARAAADARAHLRERRISDLQRHDRTSVGWGKRVSVRVDPGGRLTITTTKKTD